MTQNARQLPGRSTDCTTTGTCSAANKRLDLSYAFDANGNVGQITDNTSGGQQTRSMTYDALDRLTGATSPMFGTATYAYDALDNLTRVKLTGGSQVRDHYYCYDTSGRLGNIKTGSCSGATVIGLGYDVQGNLANKSGQTYSFDYGNRLRTVAGKEDQYHYDGHGRRALSVRRVNGSSWLRSIYSLEGQLLFQQDQGADERIDYIYLGGSLVAERKRPNTAATPLTVTYQHTDALGSPITVTDGAKAIVEQTEYEPYGQVLNRGLRTGPGYTGHMEDVATGLNYMQQRYYDPMCGCFLSVDPVTAYSNGDYRYFNRYAYAFNNPYKFFDPDGRANWLSRAFASFFGTTSGEGNPHHQPANRNDRGLGVAMVAGPAAGVLVATGVVSAPTAVAVSGRVMAATEVASMQTGLAAQQALNVASNVATPIATAAAGTIEADMVRATYVRAAQNPEGTAEFIGGAVTAALGIDGLPPSTNHEAAGAVLGTVTVGALEMLREPPPPPPPPPPQRPEEQR